MKHMVTMLWLACGVCAAQTLDFRWPTENRALAEGDKAGYFQPTETQRLISGQYGFVRTSGPEPPRYFERFHEGVDVKPVRRDAAGEPLDPVVAVAAGTVRYVNDRPGASNYGRYVVIGHDLGAHEVFTFYGHLARVAVQPGEAVAAGREIGTLGYTGTGITKDRAHLHFEITFRIQDDYARWYAEKGKKYGEETRNDHGDWNGLAFLGVDPVPVLLAAHGGAPQTVAEVFAAQEPHFRVAFPAPEHYLYWQRRFPEQVEGGVEGPVPAGWEMTCSRTGLPLHFKRLETTPEDARVVWFRPWSRWQDYFTRGLVVKRTEGYVLARHGRKWLSQLGWEAPEENEQGTDSKGKPTR
jgi:murein DD-endopeptidase MepM/ murein hydrolase activator NlpD